MTDVERGQPILQYVHELEQKVRDLRRERSGFRVASFLFGLATGGGIAWIVVVAGWLFARHR